MSSGATSFDLAKLAVGVYGRYTALTLRERLLITLSVLAATWMLWSVTVGGLLESSKVEIERDIKSVSARMQAEVAKQTALETAKANDPNVRLGRERVILDSEIRQFATSMSSALDRFVAPERMPVLLEDVIRHHRGLKLTRIHSLPVETVVVGKPGDESRAATALDMHGAGPTQIFKHPLRLEFEGDYFEVLAYLAELEASDWEFGWRRLEYVVTDHPIAQVTLEIETLSKEKSWIGV